MTLRYLQLPIRCRLSRAYVSSMKKRTIHSKSTPNKRQKVPVPVPVPVPDYHSAPQKTHVSSGQPIWPAPEEQLRNVRHAILQCAKSNQPVLILPDKDADGLTSGAILHRTLTELGLNRDLIQIFFVAKGTVAAHASDEDRRAMTDKGARYIFVLDQGSWHKTPVVDAPHTAVIIDHHQADDDDYPPASVFASACNFPPVATSSLLTYIICADLSPTIASSALWLAAIGTHGDLGNSLKWKPPFPDMTSTFKQHTKAKINSAVSLLNAPRRTAAYDVASAWNALMAASGPQDIVSDPRLLSARAEVNAEVERCAHTPPSFSSDGRVAVFRISSPAQIHPVIATRWAGHLKSSKLEIVLVANSGYIADMVNFSCRIAREARSPERGVNVIDILNEVAARDHTGALREELGPSFARGHREASGGIVPAAAFEKFVSCLDLVQRGRQAGGSKVVKKAAAEGRKVNTLTNYFQKK
jgi:hypothetical protein